jgi:regulatory protein
MQITDITEISKAKIKVMVDNDITFSLYKSELRAYNLRKDEEISEEIYHRIVDEVLVKRAKLRCLNLLKSRDYTKRQLEDKLKQGWYPDNVIDIAVEYVASYGYVDDIRYAVSYIGHAGMSKSTKQIKNDLLRKGISKEDIEAAYEHCESMESLTSQESIIEKLLQKKHYDRENATYDERQKVMGFLYRKGFSLEEIYKAVE